MSKIKLIAIMGKAGSGKSTILHTLNSNKFNKIVSCTTRPPREGEQEGVDYYFLTKEAFTNKIFENDMLEYTEFNDWYYGTTLSSLSREKVNVGVFNPASVRTLAKNSQIELITVYMWVPAKERLLRQLNREENPDVREIVRRFAADEQDFEDLEGIKYYIVENNNLEEAMATINSFY